MADHDPFDASVFVTCLVVVAVLLFVGLTCWR